MKKATAALKTFTPRLIPCSIGTILFVGASLFAVIENHAEKLPPIAMYAVFAAAFCFLCLTAWALILFIRNEEPKKKLRNKLHAHPLTARLIDDQNYRIRAAGYASLILNTLLALSRGVIGWLTSSVWLIVLAGYYLVLCVAKAWLLQRDRKIARETDSAVRERREWALYRFCGIMLIVMTAFLLGVVIMIVRDNDTFVYDGMLIYAVAAYDFYRLISSIVYMVKTRHKHAPTTVAIKVVSFATSLVAMLSLQTAMFASFGDDTMALTRQVMNGTTSTCVCLVLLVMGVLMVLKASKEISKGA